MARKTITVREAVYDRLDGHKGDDESFSDLLDRAVNALEAQEGEAGEHGEQLTTAHIDDIAAEVSHRTATELENRLQRR